MCRFLADGPCQSPATISGSLPADPLDSAQNDTEPGPSKQRRPRGTAFNLLISLRKFGAGDGIRTHDPNLGKVKDRECPLWMAPALQEDLTFWRRSGAVFCPAC